MSGSSRPAPRRVSIVRASPSRSSTRSTSNWKLVWENNRECYHCTPRHPAVREIEFRRLRRGTRARSDTAADRRRARPHAIEMGGERRRGVAPGRRSRDVSRSGQRPLVHVQPHGARGRLRHRIARRQAGRAADGRLRDANVGVLRMRSLPNFWLHASCDHAVVTRMLPAGPRTTRMRSYWLVDAERARRRRLRASTACCRSGTSPTSRTGRSASGSRRASTRSATSRDRCRTQGVQRRRVHPLVPEGVARRNRGRVPGKRVIESDCR